MERCDACDDRGYVHIDYDGTGCPEIERCDACSSQTRFNDDDAAIMHRLYCGCSVPEISEGRGDQFTHGRTMFAFPTFGPEFIKTMEKVSRMSYPLNRSCPPVPEREPF